MVGQEVLISGWVFRRRDHGGVIFVDLRDRSGFCQVVFREEIDAKAHRKAEEIRSEYVIRVSGKVVRREEENINAQIPTGEVEVEVRELAILSESKTPPFTLDDMEEFDIHEDLRLRYRYLDLRRKEMVDSLITRHAFTQSVRRSLDARGFIEVETPVLNKATPEGARDFLVPSRLNTGHFYALPQSPQIFKQLLMVAGVDKYYQIARCFRDEDLRADRQPEFTQIDLEMSFITRDEAMASIESFMIESLTEVFGEKIGEIKRPLPRMTYRETMETYGTDCPDTRFGMHLLPMEEAIRTSTFQVFQKALSSKGIVRGLCVKEGSRLTRKEIEEYTRYVGAFGAKGLAWMRVTPGGLESNIVKFFDETSQKKILSVAEAHPGDLLFFVADRPSVTYAALAHLRLVLAEKFALIDPKRYDFLWVHDFPLFEYDEREGRYQSVHHPFTMPREEDVERIETDPGSVCSQAYDFVLNGVELGGGSIRIHDSRIQERVFRLLKIDPKAAREKFGFLLDALTYGAPPHGGIAFGLDRIVMLMQGRKSIRDVIPFPKTQKGQCLMSESPTGVPLEQLTELAIRPV